MPLKFIAGLLETSFIIKTIKKIKESLKIKNRYHCEKASTIGKNRISREKNLSENSLKQYTLNIITTYSLAVSGGDFL